MTSKQLIETIRNIKDECRKHGDCTECIFAKVTGHNNCQIMELLKILNDDVPSVWDMDSIEKTINE